MKVKPKKFEFLPYRLDAKSGKIFFGYKIWFQGKGPLVFEETLAFPTRIETKKVPKALLDRILSDVHIMLGISYYKLYCPPKIIMSRALSKEQADFWNVVYRKGLGEFFYRNKIDQRNLINFPYKRGVKSSSFRLSRKNRALLGIGGGKDSIVAGEIMKDNKIDFDALLIETQKESPVSSLVVQKMEVSKTVLKRFLDEKLFQHHDGSYDGHIPISAVFAFLGYLTAILYDYSFVIVANEHSSNFGNVKYNGEDVNHQWSKSSEFENMFQAYTKEFISPDVTYFSLLRPFYEIRIAKMFSRHKRYFPLFTSCNRNFRVNRERPDSLWCGECPKCAFSFCLFSAFLSKNDLLGIFGKNLYEKKELVPVFRDILGYGKMKPFDCVGVFEEARAAMYMAREKFKDSLVIRTFLPRIKKDGYDAEKVLCAHDAPDMPDNFRFLGIENAIILGYGKEGTVTEKYLKKYFPTVKLTIADGKNDPDYLKKQAGHDLAIKTPGIPKKLVGIPYTTATNLFFSQIRNVIVGITGSKGKSTTSSLVYSIIKEAGKKVRLLGNIGRPMLEALLGPVDPEEIFVVELSSYQLDDIRYSPYIAVILNLFPEHMDYHGGVEKYYEAKKNIARHQGSSDFLIYNGKSAELKKLARKSSATCVSFDKTTAMSNMKTALRGRHNEENIKAAIAVADALRISRKVAKKAIEKFQPLPHRLERVGEFGGITFYDDAISTTPQSTIMALETIPDVYTIMLGGEDRGYDFSELEKKIKKLKVKNVILFPDSGKRIIKDYDGLNVLNTSSMEEAVKFSYENTPSGKVCLLSTASPSYSIWKNFEEKGDLFQDLVKKFSKNRP